LAKYLKLILAIVLSSIFLLNSYASTPYASTPHASTKDNKVIRLATTTSTENSGLLHYLLPKFEKDTGYQVQVIAVGTGKALRMGKEGDVDIILVHAFKAEKYFVEQGFGVKRYAVMYNDFVVIGPTQDPASIRSSTSTPQAFQSIASSKSLFISRGDDSGTHKKEKTIWKLAQVKPQGKWYREIGQGMGKAIQIANELEGYTLTDRGTWLSYKEKIDLKILYQGDKTLFNPYGIIAINPKRYNDTNIDGANALIKWMISKPGQQLIGQYKIDGEVLFTPSAN
jgi:tungstate transport system substrate-binding protein